jgi:uncharacterized protein
MSRRINPKDHPEIFGQLTTYGWLYERVFGAPAVRLEVHSGTGEIVPVPYEPQPALETLATIAEIKGLDAEPYGPVGWSKCGDCGFRSHCWQIAEEKRTVDLIYGVDQSLAAALHAEGVDTIEDLMARFDSTSLAEFKRPWGNRMQRVGKQASLILVMTEALRSGRQIVIQPPGVPDHPNYVMFDLEGLPPQLDELDKVYLWGMQVFGANPSTYLPAVAGFGEDGDRQGWQQFQRIARTILDEYGDTPFVHWASYERSRINSYIDRFGDSDGIARRVLGNLVDLLTVTKDSVALPLPSYSLKVVEQYIGFRRTQHEYGGDWSIAKFIEATETEDASTRQEQMNEILTYNHEDLEATWAVLTWLKGIGR